MARLPSIDGALPMRILSAEALPTVGAYGVTRHLSGWYWIQAEDQPCWILPVQGRREWDRAQEGTKIEEGAHRILYFEGEELHYYTGAGKVRLEQIEWIDLDEVPK
jgi:hypothetical protein